ncbi:hypothetical protein GGI43DRAFT_421509 [Trichoderma evansii]
MPQKIFERILDPEHLKTESKPHPPVAFIESCYGPVDCDTAIAALGSGEKGPVIVQWIRQLTSWFRLQHMVSDGHANLLGEEQRNSYRLLFDWWTAAYDLPIVPIFQFSQLQLMLWEHPQFDFADEHPELLKCIVKHYNVFHYYSRYRKAKGGFDSDYNKTLNQLFKAEFSDVSVRINENNVGYSILNILRREAAREAYYQQASLHCSKPKSGSLSYRHESCFPILPSRRTAGAGHDYSWVASVEASDPNFPQTLDRGPRIAPCPWLKNKNEDPLGLDGWPEYLWHLNDRRLVRIRDLGTERPAYTAISHTWGRWMNDDGYYIPNGMKYRVPLNALFDVKSLPQTLQRLAAKIDTDYAWLDLVCIPQGCKGDTLDWEHKSLKKQEVSRQGSIFRNAKRAIEFAKIAALPMVGADEILKTKTKHKREREKTRAFKQMGEESMGFLAKLKVILRGRKPYLPGKSPSDSLAKAIQPVNAWFTSLWTLQEVCLRPDMWLATSKWDFLCLDKNTRLPLNGLLCQLSKWEDATGLGKHMSLQQIDILQLGESRYCKRRRSEAIISVIGATLWYGEVIDGQYDPESDLILGKYSAKFVDELRGLIPTDFYTAYTKSERSEDFQKEHIPFTSVNGEDIIRKYYGIGSSGVSGSLIPFSKTKHDYDRTAGIGSSNTQAHSSVHSWAVNSLGQITIKRACILASKRFEVPKIQGPILCKFEGFLPTALEDRDENLERSVPGWQGVQKLMIQPDPQEWARTRPFSVHLVVVSSVQESSLGFTEPNTFTLIRGIVLRDVERDLEDAQRPRELVSIGSFFTMPKDGVPAKPIDLPEECAVDWFVL